MAIETDEQAGAVLGEVGALQQAFDNGEIPPREAALDIVARLEGVVDYMVASGGTNVYSNLVEPIVSWAQHTWMPAALRNPQAPEAGAMQVIHEFYEKHQDLKDLG